jgi:acyl-CoA oxidase
VCVHICNNSSIEKDIAFFLTRKLIALSDGQAVSDRIRALCAELAPYALHLVSAFNIPDQVLNAPIANEWYGSACGCCRL